MKDHYGREITYLRMSITELCNLRCRYCMPEEGVCKRDHTEMLTEEEMIEAVSVAASLGITKLRITGGEPLVKKNVVSICEKAAKIPGIKEIAITTNGVLLPKLARPLKDAGVKRLNISLDTLDPEKYRFITRIGSLDAAMDGIHAALDAGYEKIKVNAVLIGGFNDDEIPRFAELTKTLPIDVRFIELMPMYDSGDFGPEAYIPVRKVPEMLPGLISSEQDGGVARLYHLPDSMGNIGLISPVSAHFCKECNRLRLTADGKLKPCLHSADEYSIKGLNREEMTDMFRSVIYNKPEWHGELSYSERTHSARNMNRIGG